MRMATPPRRSNEVAVAEVTVTAPVVVARMKVASATEAKASAATMYL